MCQESMFLCVENDRGVDTGDMRSRDVQVLQSIPGPEERRKDDRDDPGRNQIVSVQ